MYNSKELNSSFLYGSFLYVDFLECMVYIKKFYSHQTFQCLLILSIFVLVIIDLYDLVFDAINKLCCHV